MTLGRAGPLLGLAGVLLGPAGVLLGPLGQRPADKPAQGKSAPARTPPWVKAFIEDKALKGRGNFVPPLQGFVPVLQGDPGRRSLHFACPGLACLRAFGPRARRFCHATGPVRKIVAYYRSQKSAGCLTACGKPPHLCESAAQIARPASPGHAPRAPAAGARTASGPPCSP